MAWYVDDYGRMQMVHQDCCYRKVNQCSKHLEYILRDRIREAKASLETAKRHYEELSPFIEQEEAELKELQDKLDSIISTKEDSNA